MVSLSEISLNKLKITYKSAPLPYFLAKLQRTGKDKASDQKRYANRRRVEAGIDNIALITKEVIDHFYALVAKPFIVPAMEAMEEQPPGQKELLKNTAYGRNHGGSILSSMKVKNLGTLPDNQHVSLFMDEYAYLGGRCLCD